MIAGLGVGFGSRLGLGAGSGAGLGAGSGAGSVFITGEGGATNVPNITGTGALTCVGCDAGSLRNKE